MSSDHDRFEETEAQVPVTIHRADWLVAELVFGLQPREYHYLGFTWVKLHFVGKWPILQVRQGSLKGRTAG